MKTRTFSSFSIEVSQQGLGCSGLSGNYVPRDDGRAAHLLRHAVDAGITYLDSSDAYGNGHNEQLLAAHIPAARRDILIGTKFGNVRGPKGQRGATDGRPGYVPVACDRSLRRLNREVIDVYLLHRVDPAVAIEDTVGAMSDLVQQGKVRFIGICEASASTIERAHAVHPLAFVQTEYSLWTRDIEAEILPTCRRLGIAVMAYAPIGRGFLSGGIRNASDLNEQDRRKDHPRFQAAHLDRNVELLTVLDRIARAHRCRPGQVALAWLHAQGDDILPIPGTTRAAHLDENIAAADLRLTRADILALETCFAPGAASGTRYPQSQMHLMNADSRPSRTVGRD